MCDTVQSGIGPYLGRVRLRHSVTLREVLSRPGTWHQWSGNTIWKRNKFDCCGEKNMKIMYQNLFSYKLAHSKLLQIH